LAFFPLVNLWQQRSSIWYFALLNIKIRFKNTQLGFVWAAVEPLIYFIILYVVFTSIRITGEDFAIYLITGIMVYHIFARGTSGGLSSLTGNTSIIKSVKVRKEFFPVVATLAMVILAVVDVGVFLGLMPVFEFTPSFTILLLPIPIFLLFVLILGISYLLSITNVYVRDVQNIWGILIHALLFISPIFWKVDSVGGVLLTIQKINPLGQLIEISHKLVIDGQIPPLSEWLYTTFFIFGIFFLGFIVFKTFERKIPEAL